MKKCLCLLHQQFARHQRGSGSTTHSSPSLPSLLPSPPFPSLPLPQWSSEPLPAVGHYPAQKERERKERLYLDIIRLFDQGKSWECGIPLCKVLATLYEEELFDYQKMASILVRGGEEGGREGGGRRKTRASVKLSTIQINMITIGSTETMPQILCVS